MILTALTFLLILSILVFVHELGHYTVARLIGVRVDEFGFGLPPRLWGKKIGKTEYSLNLLPIGGFVRLAGEDADERQEEKAKKGASKAKVSEYFWARTKLERTAILLAGVTMNFLLAVLITVVLLFNGVIEPTKSVHVEKVVSDGPAAVAGVRTGDIVSEILVVQNGQNVSIRPETPDTLVTTIKTHAGQNVFLSLRRGGEMIRVTVIPRVNPPAGQGALGIAVSNLERKHYPWYEIPVKAVTITVSKSIAMLGSMGDLVFRLATGRGVKSEEVAGPIGIASVTGEAMKYGWEAVLELMSILSLNLALLNVLPFPALDGGRLLFVVLEKMGKKTRPELERTIHQIGMMVLLALMAVITVNDILRFVRG
jgi:regulator of sigma E protease